MKFFPAPFEAIVIPLNKIKTANWCPACAHARGLDLLVVGTHGHRFFADLALGQTVAPVLHRLAIPILVVPNAARQSAAPPTTAAKTDISLSLPPSSEETGGGEGAGLSESVPGADRRAARRSAVGTAGPAVPCHEVMMIRMVV